MSRSAVAVYTLGGWGAYLCDGSVLKFLFFFKQRGADGTDGGPPPGKALTASLATVVVPLLIVALLLPSQARSHAHACT